MECFNENAIYLLGLWEIIEEAYNGVASSEEKATSTKTTAKECNENRIQDAKALAFLLQRVCKSILPMISSTTTSKMHGKSCKSSLEGMRR